MPNIKFKDIKKYVINLDKRKDRLDDITQKFDEAGYEFERWSAVDGTDLVPPADSRKRHEYNSRYIMACMQSHYNLIQQAKQEGHEYIAVFEDDIIYSSHFKTRIKLINTFPLEYDMMYLGCHFKYYGFDALPSKVRYFYRALNVGGTYAYIMKNTVFDYVLEHMDYQWGADEFFAAKIQKKFKCFSIFPSIIGHEDGMSDVAQRRVRYHYVHKHFR